MKHFHWIIVLALPVLAVGCNEYTVKGPAGADAGTGGVSVIYSTHGGWTEIKAVGRVLPVDQAVGISSVVASVTVGWNAATPASGTVASYNIYRSTSSGGQNYAAPLATGISSVTRSYTDSTVTGGIPYYYTVAPVVSGSVQPPATSADSELKVMVPLENMSLLHRWAANKEMCELMGKTPDRTQNYRCSVATGINAPPGTGGTGFVDLGGSIMVDTFEQGCNYTYDSGANKCGSADGCIGTVATPDGVVTGDANDVYYSRRSGTCYINTSAGSGTNWTAANSAALAQIRLMGSSRPGLPPLVIINQLNSQNVCTGYTVTGLTGNKRLPKRREHLLAAAWPSSKTDADILSLELGAALNTSTDCNSASGAGLTFDNLTIPADRETLPSCLRSDCAAGGLSSIRSVRTGSPATANCVSRYGIRDLVGNVFEWSSDQISCNGTSCTGVSAAANSTDNTNDDFSGILFDGANAANNGNLFSDFTKFQFPVGVPIEGAGFTGDGTISLTATQLHGDGFGVNITANTRGALNGGAYTYGSQSGRYAMYLADPIGRNVNNLGFRCVINAD